MVCRISIEHFGPSVTYDVITLRRSRGESSGRLTTEPTRFSEHIRQRGRLVLPCCPEVLLHVGIVGEFLLEMLSPIFSIGCEKQSVVLLKLTM